MAVRASHLYRSLRGFTLGAFSVLYAEREDLPFAFEEHASRGRPALYEYRPLVRGFVEARADRLARREDARLAVDDLLAEPAAAIFARAHVGAGRGAGADARALFTSILLPLVVKTAETCGGFDWDDAAFDRAYGELEGSLFGAGHSYAAIAPLVGVSVGAQVELGGGLRVRIAATGELSAHWPEAQGLLPQGFAREPDRLCVLELQRSLERGIGEAPDAPAEIADAVTALRLATAGAVAAGPVLFERVDWRPYGIRPVLPIAATAPAGEATRLDAFRGGVAAELRARLGAADDDPELGEALDRWELSLFQDDSFGAEQRRESLTALLGERDGIWAACVRAAVLLGDRPVERGELLARLRDESPPADVVRRALVETLMHGDRSALVRTLDESLLGLRPRPAGYFASRTASPTRALAVS